MRSPIGWCPAVLGGQPHAAVADKTLWHGVGLDDLTVSRVRLELRIIVHRFQHVGLGNDLRDADHCACRAAGAPPGFEQPNLAAHVIRRQAGEIGGFRMAVAGRLMAQRTGASCRLRPAMGHDLRHRRMLVGKPVRRIERIVDLRQRIFLAAAGDCLDDRRVSRFGTLIGG